MTTPFAPLQREPSEPGTNRFGTGNREPTGPGSEPGTVRTGNRPEPGTAVLGTGWPGSEPAGPVVLAVPGTAPVPGSELVPATAVPVARLGTTARAALSLRDQAVQALADQKNHKTFFHFIWNWVWARQPESLSSHRDYLKSRAWLEDWMTGPARAFLEKENLAYGILIARPVKFACQNIDKLAERQLRMLGAVMVIIGGVIIYAVTH